MNENNTNTFSASNENTWPPLLTIAQVAQILNVSPWTLRQWDNNKNFVAIRIGNRKDRRYKKEEVAKIIQQGL